MSLKYYDVGKDEFVEVTQEWVDLAMTRMSEQCAIIEALENARIQGQWGSADAEEKRQRAIDLSLARQWALDRSLEWARTMGPVTTQDVEAWALRVYAFMATGSFDGNAEQ